MTRSYVGVETSQYPGNRTRNKEDSTNTEHKNIDIYYVSTLRNDTHN